MRVRLVVPRRRRGSRLRGLTRGTVAAALGVLVLAGCGGEQLLRAAATTPAETPVAKASAATATPGLDVGITEQNPLLLASGSETAPFAAWRDRLAALHPKYVRVLVHWAALQPQAGVAPTFTAPRDGCMRGVVPCASYNGLVATLRAVRSMGATPVLTIFGTPDWAAAPQSGCERTGTTAGARMPDLTAYAAFVRSVLDLGASLGVDLPLWSPWNEPNNPAFLNPQRVACDRTTPAQSPVLYAQLASALQAQLDQAPGDQRLVLGDVAGYEKPHTHSASAAEVAAALPSSLVCGAAAWGLHSYPVRPRGGGARLEAVAPEQTSGVLNATITALDAHGCQTPPRIWITETGIGDQPGGCALMGRQLASWAADPRVDAAFQYGFRDDPVYPTGLVDAGLTHTFPAYQAWLGRDASKCAAGT